MWISLILLVVILTMLGFLIKQVRVNSKLKLLNKILIDDTNEMLRAINIERKVRDKYAKMREENSDGIYSAADLNKLRSKEGS